MFLYAVSFEKLLYHPLFVLPSIHKLLLNSSICPEDIKISNTTFLIVSKMSSCLILLAVVSLQLFSLKLHCSQVVFIVFSGEPHLSLHLWGTFPTFTATQIRYYIARQHLSLFLTIFLSLDTFRFWKHLLLFLYNFRVIFHHLLIHHPDS